MSNIPSVLQYIQVEGTFDRSPTSQSLVQSMGGSINALIDILSSFGLTIVQFTANGSFIVPANKTQVLLFGCGGGAGGNGGTDTFNVLHGGMAAKLGLYPVTVIPGDTYNVIIGAGGAGGASGGGLPGLAGGNTLFQNSTPTTLVTFYGAMGGGDYLPQNGGFGQAGTELGGGGQTAYGGSGGPFGDGGDVGADTNGTANSGAGGAARWPALGQDATNGGSGRLFIIYV